MLKLLFLIVLSAKATNLNTTTPCSNNDINCTEYCFIEAENKLCFNGSTADRSTPLINNLALALNKSDVSLAQVKTMIGTATDINKIARILHQQIKPKACDSINDDIRIYERQLRWALRDAKQMSCTKEASSSGEKLAPSVKQ